MVGICLYLHAYILDIGRSSIRCYRRIPSQSCAGWAPMCLDKPAFDLHARPHRGNVCWLLLGLAGGGEFCGGRSSVRGLFWGLSRWSGTSGCLWRLWLDSPALVLHMKPHNSQSWDVVLDLLDAALCCGCACVMCDWIYWRPVLPLRTKLQTEHFQSKVSSISCFSFLLCLASCIFSVCADSTSEWISVLHVFLSAAVSLHFFSLMWKAFRSSFSTSDQRFRGFTSGRLSFKSCEKAIWWGIFSSVILLKCLAHLSRMTT